VAVREEQVRLVDGEEGEVPKVSRLALKKSKKLGRRSDNNVGVVVDENTVMSASHSKQGRMNGKTGRWFRRKATEVSTWVLRSRT